MNDESSQTVNTHPHVSSRARWLTRLLVSAFAVSTICLTPALALADMDVVATVPTLGALAKAIGGEHVDVEVLASPDQDPHFVDARPDYIVKLNQADLLLLNGADLEIGWLPTLLTSSRNSDISVGGDGYFDASAYVSILGKPDVKIDRAEGDVHPGGNPHFLYDPRAAADIAEALAERMIELDPENEDDYLHNADKLSSELSTFASKQRKRFASLSKEKRQFVAYHESVIYLADWLQLTPVTFVEPKPGISPDPGHVASVLKTMKSKDINLLLQESYYPTGTSKKLAKLSDATLVVLPGGADADSDQSYLDYVKAFSDQIYEAME